MTKQFIHNISIIVPVFKGEAVLQPLLNQIDLVFTQEEKTLVTKNGNTAKLLEIILVHDGGTDDSPSVMRQLQSQYSHVRCVWLSRNFGQHAATLAGIATSQGDWVATIDEDGQHDPKFIGDLLDVALKTRSQLVYAKPTNLAPHGFIRNSASRFTKFVARKVLASTNFDSFSSYRLILGEPARALSAYGGTGIYLDAALLWVVASTSTCDVELRKENRKSGYSYTTLLSHFGRLIVTAGARPLRVIALLGLIAALSGFTLTIVIVWMRLVTGVTVSGWTSVIVAILVSSGVVMLSLGVISEFIGSIVRLTMGKPNYLVITDPQNGPLGGFPKSDKPLG